MKTCTICGIEKPMVDFYVAKEMKDGRKNQCKECMKNKHRKWHRETYISHPRQPKRFCPKGHDTFITGRQKNGACTVCKHNYSKLNYEKNKDKVNKRSAEWKKRNPLKTKAQQERYKEKHKDRIIARRKTQYLKTLKTLMQTPPYRYKFAIRFNKKRKIPFYLSLEEYTKFIINPCYYCGKSLQEETGIGLDRINNDKNIGYIITNILPCCGCCNKARQDLFTVDEFKIMISALLKYRESKK